MTTNNSQTEEEEMVTTTYELPVFSTNPPAIVKPAEPAPERHGVCSVYLRINGTLYAAKCVRTPEGKLWRLRKPDGPSYDVHRGADGMQCDCWDWVARWANRETA